MKGRKGLKNYERFCRSSGIVLRLLCGGCLSSKQGRPQVESVSSAQTIEKGWLLLGKMCVGWQHAHHGRYNALMKALNCSSCPYTIALISNLLIDEAGILMCGSSGLHHPCNQFL